ncbi:hypothetical protein SAMN04488061_0688 [Filomicrobium insigne]|uniref:Transposase n=1 Tax=Filomicrobium insigne TaxID=418854 RepID=A0A1H0I0I1_9HYPH|nr:hypothetical protein SAMN04488061_0688 [Filomicrobium insigne]
MDADDLSQFNPHQFQACGLVQVAVFRRITNRSLSCHQSGNYTNRRMVWRWQVRKRPEAESVARS